MREYRPAPLGILYAEDFGIDRAAAPAPPPPAPPPPALTQADIESACVRAVQAAERAWLESAAERRAEALAAIADSLLQAKDVAAAQTEAVAEGVARTVLSMVAGLLPQFCRTHGDAEVRALVVHLAPLLARSSRLVIRAHPGLLEHLTGDIAALDEPLAANVELRPANLPPGDVRIAWEGGSFARDPAAICTAIQDGLAQFGLFSATAPDQSSTRTGILAHAE
jgi:hypothetical protein